MVNLVTLNINRPTYALTIYIKMLLRVFTLDELTGDNNVVAKDRTIAPLSKRLLMSQLNRNRRSTD